MKICEIFHSIQGEGINAGIPSIFIRFFGCNLQCKWCDTKQSWHKDHAMFKELEIEEIIKEIQLFNCKHIVFTGGEPTLFQDRIKTITSYLSNKYSFELETNGSFSIQDNIWQTINISPKLKNSGNKVYEVKANNFPEKTWWKFVIEDEADMSEILEIQQKYDIPNERILLMPQGQTKIEIEKNSPKIIELCKKHNFRFSPRLHLIVGVR